MYLFHVFISKSAAPSQLFFNRKLNKMCVEKNKIKFLCSDMENFFKKFLNIN